MKIRNSAPWLILERVIPSLVLAILLTYTYAKFFRHSYGFRVEPSTGLIVLVFDKQPEPTLRENDQIFQIGSVRWEDFDANLSQAFLEGYKPGDTVPIRVERDGQQIDISWKYPHWNEEEFRDQFESEWWFAYVFWLAGVLTILLVRPKDDSWVLMWLFNFLTAIWLIAGSGLSAYHIWYSAIVLRVAVWLCLPVYLHLHWVFPRPLGKLPRWLVGSVYGVSILLIIAQVFELLPSELYLLGFTLALVGSLILLLIHLWRQPSIRRDFRLLLVALILAIVPPMTWVIVDNIFSIPSIFGSLGIVSLPLLSFAYLYTAFRRRLGNLELRVNRFFTIYLFLILLSFFVLLFIAFVDQIPDAPGKAATIGFTSLLLTAAAFIGGYPPFERFVDRRIFGVAPPSTRLLESFSIHITTSVAVPDLIRVLQDEVFPSLLIRQFAFLHHDQGSLNVLSTMGLHDEPLPSEKDVLYLMSQSGSYRSPDLPTGAQPFSWVRLILSLKLGDQLLGFWLLGRRDPDDLYSQQEALTLTSLANLTAIALSNIIQTERLTSMYEANINRYEEERLSLARDLHDSILNEMAALPIRSDAPVFPLTFQQAYEGLSEELREIVNNLRPPMLSFGLKLALEAFANNLKERNQEPVEILVEIRADGECRYPLIVENNLYRIVQEACENSLRYARAKKLSITGRLEEQHINLRVEDNGIGLDPEISLKLNDLLASKHYGLVGMFERANVIGAELSIYSQPKERTQIDVTWKSKDTDLPL
ncbi:MAG TPA: ATP-binding protein [Anaerolineales bacterium]|nr:ATP-binding protein [Anaerolineales bacterium]